MILFKAFDTVIFWAFIDILDIYFIGQKHWII